MKSRLFFLIAVLLLCAPRLPASQQSDTEALNLAVQVETELTGAIDRASSTFAFVGGGSGVVISPDGYILTNHHVAGDGKQRTVRVYGTQKFYVCDLVGTDPVGDLCLLKARDADKLPFIVFGDIDAVKVGQQCLTIGDPFKLADKLEGPPSVSLGTVSALHRYQYSSQYNYCDAIQTDAAINLGNSGGPMVTLDGKLIGITGQMMSRFGAKANTGIGYAIPIDQVARFIPVLKTANGKTVYHGTLPDGLSPTPTSLDEMQVASVESVEPGSEAARWGFAPGDKILSVNDKPVLNYWRLRGIVQSYPENFQVKIIIQRNDKRYSITEKLPRMPLPPAPADIAALGLKVARSYTGEGLEVLRVDADSIAERTGLMKDDIIVRIAGKQPASNWQDALLAKRLGEKVAIEIHRTTPTGQVQHTLTMTLDRLKN